MPLITSMSASVGDREVTRSAIGRPGPLSPISTQLIHPSLQACRAVVFGKSAQVSHTDRRGARRPRGCDLSANALSTVWSTHVSKGPAMSEIARDRTYVTGLSSLIVTTDQPSVPVTAE